VLVDTEGNSGACSATSQSYMDEGVRILELARNAQPLFERQPAREKRRLLNFVLSNCSWEDGEVVATFRQPFDLLSETTALAARSSAENNGNSSRNEIWLREGDCGRTFSTDKPLK
jgi:site-specific DNA recombinase